MSSKARFKAVGQAYLAALEGAIGCPIDADYPGKTFDLADVAATLRRFYLEWAPQTEGLSQGTAVMRYGNRKEHWSDLHTASGIAPPLRDQTVTESGIYIVTQLNNPERIRSLLMFADAILFWDPLEESFRGDRLDSEIVSTALAHLQPLRSLIAEGLVIPAQLARSHRAEDEDTERTHFENTLMWRGALGKDRFSASHTETGPNTFEVEVPPAMRTAKGFLGYAENKLAAMFLPDVVIPLMSYDSLSDYQEFCRNIDDELQAREVRFAHESLAFETGFIINPERLDNSLLLELRDRDVIFSTFRSTVVEAMRRYEEEVATGHATDFLPVFNETLQAAFRDLKDKALVSNTWKEFVDEQRSFGGRILAKVATTPLTAQTLLQDLAEAAKEGSISSAGNLLAATFKTYSRYRNTKLLMDLAGAVREVHGDGDNLGI